MLSKLMIMFPFAMGMFLYYDLTGALLFTTLALFLELVIGK